MLNLRNLLLMLCAVFAAPSAVGAQQHPLVGTWEEIDGRIGADGSVQPARANVLIVGADGYYMSFALPPNRPKVNKPLTEMTKDELIARFIEVRGQRGTYSVSGDRLTTQRLGSVDPNEEARRIVRIFRIEGDVLTLTAGDPAVKLQSRFRRLPPGQVLQAGPTPSAAPQAALEDRFFDSNGVRIRYVEAGTGEPIVLVHSMSDSIEMWRDRGVIDALASTFRVVAFDSRGHGRSDKPREPIRYGQEMANDIARLLDHLQIRRAHVVGYSMGGYVAGRFAATFPDRVLTVTFGGSSVMSPALWTARFEQRVVTIADALERGDPRPLLGRFLEGQELEERARELFARSDLRALAAAVRSFKAMTLSTKEIAGLPMPLLVVVGSDDLPDSRVQAFEGLQPRLRVVTIDGATHGGPRGTLRRPEFVRALREFLDAYSGAPRPR